MHVRRAFRGAGILAIASIVAACPGKTIPVPPPELLVRDPLADSVESVLFLIGDGARPDGPAHCCTGWRSEVDRGPGTSGGTKRRRPVPRG